MRVHGERHARPLHPPEVPVNRTSAVLLLACLLASACQATPAGQAPQAVTPAAVAAPPAGTAVVAAPTQAPVQAGAELAHDGGIVYWAPLDAITDPAKKRTAAEL